MRLAFRHAVKPRIELEQSSRRILCLLHVRFVERVDVQQKSGSRSGDFPSNEFSAELRRIGDVEVNQKAVIANCQFWQLACHRHNPLSILSGAFGDELLDPKPDRRAAIRHAQRELVTAFLRRSGHCGAK